MNPAISQSSEIHAPNAKSKADILVWKALEEVPGPFDLNFRMAWDHTEEGRRFLCYSVGIIMLTLGVSCLPFIVFYLLSAPEIAGGALLIGVFLVACDYGSGETVADRLVAIRQSLLKIIVPFGLWVFCVTVPYLTYSPGMARSPGLLLALVAIVILADRIATHQVWYATASPLLSVVTMKKWRAAWSARYNFWLFEPFPDIPPRRYLSFEESARHRSCIISIRGFGLDLTWLFIPWAFCFFLVLGTELMNWATGRCLDALGVTALMALFAWARNRSHLRQSVVLVWETIISYFGYQRGSRWPGWCLMSPVGSQRHRQVLMLLVIAWLAVVMAQMADFYPVTLLYPDPWEDVATRLGMTTTVDSSITYASLIDRTPGWKTLLTFGLREGKVFFLLHLAVCFVLSVVVPLATFFLAIVAAIGPVVKNLHDVLDAPHSHEQETGLFSDWEGYGARLRESSNPSERKSLLLAVAVPSGIPVLLDWELLFEHFRITAATGMGKTHLGLMGLFLQIVRRTEEVPEAEVPNATQEAMEGNAQLVEGCSATPAPIVDEQGREEKKP